MNSKFVLPATIFLFGLAIISSCNSTKPYNATTIGEMEDLIKKGDMTTHIVLKDIETAPHAYAIGSVTNLKGSIVVNDGKPYTSFVQGDTVAIDSTWNTEATVLVYAHADQWKEIEIPSEIKDWKQLEKFVSKAAKEYNINENVAFPFLLKGKVASVNWRVSDWDINDKEITNKKIKNAGLKGIATNVHATLVGFYCTKQYRVLADHTTKMHIHFVSDDRKVSGHADDLELDGHVKLLLPVEGSQ